MALWIVGRQALPQGEPRIINRRDDNLIAFDRYPHALIDMQARFPRHRSRQANTETIAPLLDAQDGLGHDTPPRVFV